MREWAWEGYFNKAAPYFSPGQLYGAHLPRAPAALHIPKSCCCGLEMMPVISETPPVLQSTCAWPPTQHLLACTCV